MKKKGQVTLEAILILMLVLLAFLCMRKYFKGAFQSYMRTYADSFCDEQYSPAQSWESGLGSPLHSGSGAVEPGTLVYVDTVITTNLTGQQNILAGGGNVIALPRTGTGTGGW